jgi:DNA-binding transcriptional regulator LsrR (DeoR family)
LLETNAAMNDPWNDLDHDILDTLEHGAMAPVEIGARLGISERAAESLLAMLAAEGKIRIRLVERPS